MCDLCQFCECREYCSNERNNYGKSETTNNIERSPKMKKFTKQELEEHERYIKGIIEAKKGIKYKGYTITLVEEALDDFYEVTDKNGEVVYREAFYLCDTEYCVNYLKECIDTQKSRQERIEKLGYNTNNK